MYHKALEPLNLRKKITHFIALSRLPKQLNEPPRNQEFCLLTPRPNPDDISFAQLDKTTNKGPITISIFHKADNQLLEQWQYTIADHEYELPRNPAEIMMQRSILVRQIVSFINIMPTTRFLNKNESQSKALIYFRIENGQSDDSEFHLDSGFISTFSFSYGAKKKDTNDDFDSFSQVKVTYLNHTYFKPKSNIESFKILEDYTPPSATSNNSNSVNNSSMNNSNSGVENQSTPPQTIPKRKSITVTNNSPIRSLSSPTGGFFPLTSPIREFTPPAMFSGFVSTPPSMATSPMISPNFLIFSHSTPEQFFIGDDYKHKPTLKQIHIEFPPFKEPAPTSKLSVSIPSSTSSISPLSSVASDPKYSFVASDTGIESDEELKEDNPLLLSYINEDDEELREALEVSILRKLCTTENVSKLQCSILQSENSRTRIQDLRKQVEDLNAIADIMNRV